MGKKSRSGIGSGMNIPDHFFESLQTFFWVKIFDADADPGSGNLFDPGYGIQDGKNPQHCFLFFKSFIFFYFEKIF
jgi:hypothetical protein